MLGWTAPDGIALCQGEVVVDLTKEDRPWRRLFALALIRQKLLFQVHGVDEAENPVLRKKLRRNQFLELFAQLAPLSIGLEACGASHYWARELRALGHDVVLLPPQYVKPYVKRGKSDAADAEAICEAMSRPTMRLCSG